MQSRAARSLLVPLMLVVSTGCQSSLGARHQGEEGLAVDLSVSTAEITSGWMREGDYLVSPANEEEAVATRVGMLVHLAAEDGTMPLFEARATEGGEPVGDWVPVSTTWSEGSQQVAVADLGTTSAGAQIRVPVDAVDQIAGLLWNASVPEEALGDGEAPPSDLVTEELTSSLTGLGIVTRAVWGAAPTRCTTRDATYRRMAVHYTMTPSVNPESQVRGIQRYHMDTRGWCDVGYHFLVGIDGRIFEGRPIGLLGAHVSGNNTGNIGVSFVGCFHSTSCSGMGPTTPPDAMLQGGGRLLGTLSRVYGINLDRSLVKGHREHTGASTDCPGDYLFSRIDQLLTIGRASSLGDPTTMPAPTPSPTPMPTTCGAATTCGSCEATSGCGYCASRGVCGATTDACTFAGDVGSVACNDALWPCATATCWNPTAAFAACGSWSIDEDFSSGSFSVHRYWAHVYPGGRTTLRLERTAGTLTPAILVSDRAGRLAYGGDVASLHPDVRVVSATTGRSGTFASVTLEAARDLDVYVYVTGWNVLDGAFRGSLSTTARYRFTASEDCSSTTTPPMTSASVYGGLTQSGSEIPRAGLANATLRGALGVSTEPYGSVVTYLSESWVSGRVSWFGGPSDTGVTTTETGAVSGERLRSLATPEHADRATIASRPADYYFIAMRWNYSPNGTSWWRNARLVITNPRTGAQVVVRPVDWGPNTSTGRAMDLSQQTLTDLGLTTDDTALVAFARPGTALGPVAH
jgi:hypothetical protein